MTALLEVDDLAVRYKGEVDALRTPRMMITTSSSINVKPPSS